MPDVARFAVAVFDARVALGHASILLHELRVAFGTWFGHKLFRWRSDRRHLSTGADIDNPAGEQQEAKEKINAIPLI